MHFFLGALRVNDMVISINLDCNIFLNADDSTILLLHKDPDQIANTLGTVLETYSHWIVDNKL